jgi:GTPase SAR1 family protein
VEENKKARKIEISMAKEYADEISAKFVETSAKTGYNIDYLFMMIAEDYINITRHKVQANADKEPGINLQLEQPTSSDDKCKC